MVTKNNNIDLEIMRLSDVCDEITSGGAAPQGVRNFLNGVFPFVRVADMGKLRDEKYIYETRDSLNEQGICKLRKFPAGTVLFTKSGASLLLNQRAILKKSMYVVSHIGCLIPNKKVISDWLYYWLKQVDFAKYAHATTLPSLKLSTLAELRLPVPPISKQQRIVTNIEELLTELDKAVETLQIVKQQLVVYRQAVLKEAFEGKFTEEWRNANKNPVLSDFEHVKIINPVYCDTAGDENELKLNIPDKWLLVRIGDLFPVEVGATPKRSIGTYWEGNINWASSGEVDFNTITQTNERITEDGLRYSSTNVQPRGTILLAMIGEGKTRGKAAVLNVEAAHNQNTAAILVSKTPCCPKYLFYYLMLSYENTRRVGSGNNQKALNKERVRALRFPFTSFAEQSEIVRVIESHLSVCDGIEQTIGTSLERAEALRQSILKSAFEGKLV